MLSSAGYDRRKKARFGRGQSKSTLWTGGPSRCVGLTMLEHHQNQSRKGLSGLTDKAIWPFLTGLCRSRAEGLMNPVLLQRAIAAPAVPQQLLRSL